MLCSSRHNMINHENWRRHNFWPDLPRVLWIKILFISVVLPSLKVLDDDSDGEIYDSVGDNWQDAHCLLDCFGFDTNQIKKMIFLY